jgi:predicted transcriptional regulator
MDAPAATSFPETLQQQLAQLAELTGQSEADIVQLALQEYLDCHLPEMLELQASEQQADRKEFSSKEEVREVFARYGA